MPEQTVEDHTQKLDEQTNQHQDNERLNQLSLTVKLGLTKLKRSRQLQLPTKQNKANSWTQLTTNEQEQQQLVNFIKNTYSQKHSTTGLFPQLNAITYQHIQKIDQKLANSWFYSWLFSFKFGKKQYWLDKRFNKSRKWWQALWRCQKEPTQSQTIKHCLDEEIQNFINIYDDFAQRHLVKNKTFERQSLRYQQAFSSADDSKYRRYQYIMGMLNSSFPLYYHITDPKQRFYVYLLRNKAQLIDEQINQWGDKINNKGHQFELNDLPAPQVLLHSMLSNQPFFENQYNEKPNNNNNESNNTNGNDPCQKPSESRPNDHPSIQISILNSSVKSHVDELNTLTNRIYTMLANKRNRLQPLPHATIKHKKHDTNMIKIKLPLLFIHGNKPYVFDMVIQYNIYNCHFGYFIDPPQACSPINNIADEFKRIGDKLSTYKQSIWTTEARKAISNNIRALLTTTNNDSNTLTKLYKQRKQILAQDHEVYRHGHPLFYFTHPLQILTAFTDFIKSFRNIFRNRHGSRLQKLINEASYIWWRHQSSTSDDNKRQMLYQEFKDAAQILSYFKSLYFELDRNQCNNANNSLHNEINDFVEQANQPQPSLPLHTLYERYKKIVNTLYQYSKDFDNDHRYKNLFNLLITKQSHIKVICKEVLQDTHLAEEVTPSQSKMIKLFFRELTQPNSILHDGHRELIIDHEPIKREAFTSKYRDHIYDLLATAKNNDGIGNDQCSLSQQLQRFFQQNPKERSHLRENKHQYYYENSWIEENAQHEQGNPTNSRGRDPHL